MIKLSISEFQKPSSYNEAKYKTFLVKISFICMIIKNHFHKKGFALGLVLKQRLAASRKWPIATSILILISPSLTSEGFVCLQHVSFQLIRYSDGHQICHGYIT